MNIGPKEEMSFVKASFPWHFFLSEEMQVFGASTRLLHHCPEYKDGTFLGDLVKIVRPKISFDFSLWSERPRTTFTLLTIKKGLSFRCQAFLVHDLKRILVCCRPWSTSISELQSQGISMEDMGVHDPTWEFLMLLKERDRIFAENLKHQEHLEELVQERTQELNSLLELASIATGNLDADFFYTSVADKICEILNVGDCRIFTSTSKGLSLRGCRGGLPDNSTPENPGIGEELAERAVVENKMQLNLPGEICAPLLLPGGLQAVVAIHPKQGESLDEDDGTALSRNLLVVGPAFEASQYRENLEVHLGEAVTDRHRLLEVAEKTDPLLFSPGDQLGEVCLIKPIGRSLLGNVWEAMQENLDRTVAVRILGHTQSVDEETRGRFRSEASAASAIDHFNILDIYSVGEDQGTVYVVMESTDGWNTLDDYFGLMKPIPIWPSVFFKDGMLQFVKILEALDSAHKQGTIHGSLHPGNILVDSNLEPKIVGFGTSSLLIAKSLSDASTFKYLSRFMSSDRLSNKAQDAQVLDDLFSIGAILKMIFSDPSGGGGLRPETPKGLAAIVQKAGHENLESRYLSIQDVRKDLILWLENNKKSPHSRKFFFFSKGRKKRRG